MSARGEIVARIRSALKDRPAIPHPGSFAGRHLTEPTSPIEAFQEAFEAAGGEVVHVENEAAARAWVEDFCQGVPGAAPGTGVPASLCNRLRKAAPARADVGISMAHGAIGETGSLVLTSRDGRLAQLLPPTHVVLVDADRVVGTLHEALLALPTDASSAVGLHSGPSKSADIGQILVKGVHGPGRVVAVIVGSVG